MKLSLVIIGVLVLCSAAASGQITIYGTAITSTPPLTHPDADCRTAQCESAYAGGAQVSFYQGDELIEKIYNCSVQANSHKEEVKCVTGTLPQVPLATANADLQTGRFGATSTSFRCANALIVGYYHGDTSFRVVDMTHDASRCQRPFKSELIFYVK
jgi:hypothetical protein